MRLIHKNLLEKNKEKTFTYIYIYDCNTRWNFVYDIMDWFKYTQNSLFSKINTSTYFWTILIMLFVYIKK